MEMRLCSPNTFAYKDISLYIYYMFIKSIVKKDRHGKRKYLYYRLCESYRVGLKVRHKTLLSLGKLEKLTSIEQRKLLADRIESLLLGQSELFSQSIPKHVEQAAQKYYALLREKNKIDSESAAPPADDINTGTNDDDNLVKLNTLIHKEGKEIGGEWLCLQAMQQLKLPEFFAGQGWDEKQINIALAHVIAKAVYPASENLTAKWLEDNSALKDLLFSSPTPISRYMLYKSSLNLYHCKEALENHLSRKTNELFDIDDKIILYDLTNTYFEGRRTGSKKSKFGRSKEKRSDAKLLALALVCNQEGFVKYSKIYEGNISEPATLCKTIDELAGSTTSISLKPMIVMDAGIAAEDNLRLLKEKGYHYLCVTRSKLKDYVISKNKDSLIKVFDNREQKIEIQHVEKQGQTE